MESAQNGGLRLLLVVERAPGGDALWLPEGADLGAAAAAAADWLAAPGRAELAPEAAAARLWPVRFDPRARAPADVLLREWRGRPGEAALPPPYRRLPAAAWPAAWAAGRADVAHTVWGALRGLGLEAPPLASPWRASETADGLEAAALAPGVWALPLRSSTLRPFDSTNAVVLRDGPRVLLVDPSARDPADSDRLLAWLDAERGPRPPRVDVFLTHHHADHWESWPAVAAGLRARGRAPRLLASADTLARLPPAAVALAAAAVDVLAGGPAGDAARARFPSAAFVAAPGHTAGHAMLLARGVLVAGDHVVGFGSAVLDADAGGDVDAYLRSCDAAAALGARWLLPQHGAPCPDAAATLAGFRAHRLARDAQIAAAAAAAPSDAAPDALLAAVLAAVYPDLPDALRPHAASNVRLHLRRLAAAHPADRRLTEFLSQE
jgi:glyoxylase-like metal-dependent hydrolase (beta-lactamase superfamily II)